MSCKICKQEEPVLDILPVRMPVQRCFCGCRVSEPDDKYIARWLSAHEDRYVICSHCGKILEREVNEIDGLCASFCWATSNRGCLFLV